MLSEGTTWSYAINYYSRRFRWAYLQVQEFSNCVDVDQIETALSTLPEDLEATYERALCRIPKHNTEKARLMLLLIAHSLEPLSLAEVANAVSLPEPNDVLNICTSTFVSAHTIKFRYKNSSSPNYVRLDHFSVKEYLISNHLQQSTASYFYESEQLAHLVLSKALVSFLIRTWNQQPDLYRILSYSTDSFLKYSIKHWFRHARKGQTPELQSLNTEDPRSTSKTSTLTEDRESLEGHIHKLFRVESSAAFAAWFASFCDGYFGSLVNQIRIPRPSRNTPFPPLSCASLLGLTFHVEKLIDDGANIDARLDTETYRIDYTALQFAACEGHLDVLSKLLDKGATVTQQDLELIAAGGRANLDEVLQILLEKKPELVIGELLVERVLGNRSRRRLDALAFLLSANDSTAFTRNAIVKAIKCSDTTIELDLLLRYCNNSIKLDVPIDTEGVEPSPDQIKLLFKSPKIIMGIEERCFFYRMSLQKAALMGSEDSEYLDLLPLALDVHATVSRQVVQRQAINRTVTVALLNNIGYHEIDEGLLLAAAKNENKEADNLMRFLLLHLVRDLVITEFLLENIAACRGTGKLLLMEYVLQHKPDEVGVTENAVIAGVKGSYFDPDKKFLKLLLGARRREPELSTAVIEAVLEKQWYVEGPAILIILFKHMGPNVLLSEEIMELARERDDWAASLGLSRFQRTRTYTAVLEDYRSKQMVNVGDRGD